MQDEIENLLTLTPKQLSERTPATVSEALARELLLRALGNDSEALRLVVAMTAKSSGRRRAATRADVKIIGGLNKKEKDEQ